MKTRRASAILEWKFVSFTIVIKVEWLWNPLDSLIICFCELFWTWLCTTFNSIPVILNLLTNRNIALIYSVTICEQTTKDCEQSGSFQHKLLSTVVFNFVFVGFHNQSPLPTMLVRISIRTLKFLKQRLSNYLLLPYKTLKKCSKLIMVFTCMIQ